MFTYLLRRIVPSLLTMLVMAVVVFIGVYAIGNPIDILIDPAADQATRETVMRNLGLDLPLHEQFLRFIANALQGDLGNSFVHNVPALKLILDRLPATLELAGFAIFMAILIGIPLGMWAGLKPESPIGKTIMTGSILGFSLPTFWVGLMFILLFSVLLGWLPSGGRGEVRELFGIRVSFLTWDGLQHLLLPALTLSLYKTALVIRLARAGTREVAQQDYIRFARAKGLGWTRVVFVHMLKNILIPIVTVLGLELGSLIAFAVVTETVFAWPGMGRLLIQSILGLDRPVVVAYLLLVVFLFILINIVVDILYSILDPRVRLGKKI